jgi:hypothetical protein
MSNSQATRGKLDAALVTGSHALEIAERLGDLRLRISTTGNLLQTHHFRGEYNRVIELATANFTALPAESVYENLGLRGPL